MSKWQRHIIKAGKKRDVTIGMLLKGLRWNKDSIKGQFKVSDTWYNDVNAILKIVGFSDGLHQKNSVRLGWTGHNNIMWLHSYCYINGVSPQENTEQKYRFKIQIFPDDLVTFNIYRKNGFYGINIMVEKSDGSWEGDLWSIKAGKNKRWGYMLYPNMDGRINHDVHVLLKID